MSLSESVSIFNRVNESFDHVTRTAALVQHVDPVQIQRIRISAQITKVFHHHKRLVVVLLINVSTLGDETQRMRTIKRAVVERINDRLPVRQTDLRRVYQRVNISRIT